MATPIFSPDGGTYFITQARPVTISTTTTGAHLRYTLDGSTPTSSHGVEISFMSGTVLVLPTPGGRTLQAIGFKPGMTDSEVHSAIYTYEGNGTAPELEPGRGTNGSIAGVASDALTYDDNGNLQTYQGWTYTYDSQNRLTKASKGGVWAIFHYDGKNRQIARNINGDIRFSVWDGWELLEEYDSHAQVIEAYLQGAHGVIKSLMSNIYYCQDKLGSTTHIADAAGNLLESYRYDLYGTPSYYDRDGQLKNIEVSDYGITDLYAGERWIGELKLYDLRNRFMSPELGRFLQTDPIGFKGDASNLYRYCHNDPEDFSDPMGLYTTSSLTSFGGGDWGYFNGGVALAQINLQQQQPAGNEKGALFSAIGRFENGEGRGKGISGQEVVDTGVGEGREAERLVRGDIRTNPSTKQKYGIERGTSEFVNGKHLEKGGPVIGVNDERNPRVALPLRPNSGSSGLGPRFMGIHAHGPQSGRSFDYLDIPSSEGRFGNSRYISVVTSTKDHGKDVHFHVPRFGTWSTSDGGITFRAGD